ncbi:MAG: LysE family transporter [Dehalococcoidia bacterium]|nr:LysE family transporter [Dehalococcoidia bacterium]
MDFAFLFKGIAIGFAIAVPVGPIGAICIGRTLSEGRAAGLASGLGAATADAAFASVAAFGITAVSDALVDHSDPFRLAGGLFLCFLALRMALVTPPQAAVVPSRGGLVSAYASTFLLTLTNPLTILSFAAVFAGLDIVSEGGRTAPAVALVAGVFAGSSAWWLVLSGGVGALRSRLGLRALRSARLLSAVVIGGFGVAALASLAL